MESSRMPPLQLYLTLLNVYHHFRVPLLQLAIHINQHGCVTGLRIFERWCRIAAPELGLKLRSVQTLRQALCESRHLPVRVTCVGHPFIRRRLVPNGITVDIDGSAVSVPRAAVVESVSPTGKVVEPKTVLCFVGTQVFLILCAD
jgi:hypothetical protein